MEKKGLVQIFTNISKLMGVNCQGIKKTALDVEKEFLCLNIRIETPVASVD